MATTLSEITAAARDMATGLIKGNTADTLGAPVDLINTATKPVQEALGIYSDQPFAGSASFRKLFGMEVNDKNVAETAGSMISVGGAAKAMIVGAGRMEKLGKADLQKATEFLNKHPEVNAGSVFNATGVYRGEEGGLRTVLSDKGANLKPSNLKVNNSVKLDELLDHPELFAAYPELRNVDVVSTFGRKTGEGSYVGSRGLGDNPTISLSASDTAGAAGVLEARGGMIPRGEIGFGGKPSFGANTVDKVLDVLLHETQHAIQNIEKWTRGGSPKEFLPSNIDKQAQAVQKAVIEGRKSEDTSVQKAAERFKERFNNKIKDAHTKYENVPGEQEARFTQETRNMDAGQLGNVVLNMLRSGQTPQSFDTQVLPSVAAKNQATKQPASESADLASAVFNMLTNPTK